MYVATLKLELFLKTAMLPSTLKPKLQPHLPKTPKTLNP